MWSVLIHPLIFKEDFKKIDSSAQQRIIKAIRKKLAADPTAYGHSLSGDLKGYWRLRVDNYRVIYSIINEQVMVKIIKVGIRRDAEVYEEMIKRLGMEWQDLSSSIRALG